VIDYHKPVNLNILKAKLKQNGDKTLFKKHFELGGGGY
jgi:hypothetical protein